MKGLIPANIKCCFLIATITFSILTIFYPITMKNDFLKEVMTNTFPTQSYLSGHERNLVTFKSSIKKNYQYSARFYSLEIRGPGYFTLYPYRVTTVGDVYHVDYLYDLDQIKSKVAELHAMGVKIILYKPFSSLSERKDFIDYWNLSKEDIAPMDLNGTYYVDLPYSLGYEGRDAWRNFFISFMKFLFVEVGIDGVEFDGGDGYKDIGSFDPETMQKFNQYLASKYNATELQVMFNITDISTFNFAQYLIDLGYNHHSFWVTDNVCIAHPGIEGPRDNEYAKALWREFQNFNLKMILELYKLLWENVKQWETETGRDFYISTRFGCQHFNPGNGTEENDLFVLQYVDGMNWEYTWEGYPNRTASVVFRIVQSLNKTFNPWIAPFSSLESTGFTEWFTSGWNKSADPEEQYLGLSEIIVYGGHIPGSGGTNETHFSQFIRLVQDNPQLFGQSSFGEIALIYPVATAININDLNMTSVFGDSFDGYEGAYYLLADSHRVFDIVVFGDNYWVNITPPLSKLLKYKAIVLSNAVCLPDSQVELLKQYLENGGIIIGIGEIATHNEFGKAVNRDFANLFDGKVHSYGNGLIISIKNISTSDYLLLRTQHDSSVNDILNEFQSIVDKYVPRDIQTNLPTRAHIYRFYNYDENALIFQIINFNYNFGTDKVIKAYNVNFSFKLLSQLKNKQLSVWVYSEDSPEGIEVPYSIDNDFVSVTIPKVSILTIIEIRPRFEYHEPKIIDQPTVYNGEVITINRSWVVSSTLVLRNSLVRISGGVKPIKIEVLPGGSLIIKNSKILKETGTYYIVARKGSSVFINESDISGAGLFGSLEKGGICIEAENTVILNSKIHDNYDYGIMLFSTSHAIIGNNIFSNNSIGVALVNSSFIDFYNNTVSNNSVGICVESPDIIDIGARLRALNDMYYKERKVPPRGGTKITIADSYVSDNIFFNIIVIESNFVTITRTIICGASVANVFSYQSIIKIHNCTIANGWIGAYIEECPIVTILGNKIFNNSYIGLKFFKCVYTGVLHWIHLEPVGDKIAETRIIGNYIQDNTYGIHMDTDGYFNDYFRISNNEIKNNKIGIYVNATNGHIYENNFIGNEKHAIGGKDPLIHFYLNISKVMYGFLDNPVGNYWDNYDNDGKPYEIFSGYYDYFPLNNSIQIPMISDNEGPYIKVENVTIVHYNATHVEIKFHVYVSDQNYVGTGNSKLTLPNFGVVNILGPNMKQLEFPWNGYSGGLLGPEYLTNTYNLSVTFNLGATATGEEIPMPAEWLENAKLTVYCSDMYGNWNKNDTVPPHIAVVLREPTIVLEGNVIKIYALVSDWSSISKVQLSYSNGSTWYTLNMTYDTASHLYYVLIPPQASGTTVIYRLYAEDIYGNNYLSEEYEFIVVKISQPSEGGEITPDYIIYYIVIAVAAVVVVTFVAVKLLKKKR